jgi:hypothetical protein
MDGLSALTWMAIAILGFLFVSGGAMFLLSKTMSALRRRRQRRVDAHFSSLQSEVARMAQLMDEGRLAELETTARRLLDTPSARPAHAPAHTWLGVLDDRRGDFVSVAKHLEAAESMVRRAIVPPTQLEVREHRQTLEIVTLNLAFAFAATGRLEDAEKRLRDLGPIAEDSKGLRLRVDAVLLARRGEWDALSNLLSVDVPDDERLGPASKLLLRVLKARAVGPYRASQGASREEPASQAGEDEAKGREWVAKVLGEAVS